MIINKKYIQHHQKIHIKLSKNAHVPALLSRNFAMII